MSPLKKILLLLCILAGSSVFSQTRQVLLSGPDISSDSQIAVIMTSPVTEGYEYSTAVLGAADKPASQAVTVYPEESAYFSQRKELRLYNHYGLYHYEQEKQSWYTADYLPSFAEGRAVTPLRLLPVYHSPDGRYTVFAREEEDFTVSLHLYDHDRRVSVSITAFLPREFTTDLVKWSPDSRYFIYRRSRELYYFSIDQYLSSRIPAEEFRTLGHSYMNSAAWGLGNYLYLFSGKLLYRLHSSEFFTRSFYADPFQKGSVWGRIPLAFDPQFDQFSVSPRGDAVFLYRDEKDGFVFSLESAATAGDPVTQAASMAVPEGYRISHPAWIDNTSLLLQVSGPAEEHSRVYLLDRREDSRFRLLADKDISGFAIGPEGKEIALLEKEKITILNSSDKEVSRTLTIDAPLQIFWTEKGYILLGRTLQKEVSGSETRTIGLSQAERVSFTAENGLLAAVGSDTFLYRGNLQWEPAGDEEIRQGRLSNDNYRIYLEDRPGSWYAQSLKIRKADSYTTSEFLRPFRKNQISAAVPVYRQNRRDVPWYVTKGNSFGRKEVSLVFNVSQSAEGLGRLLQELEGYGIKAAFFLNGDFINNYPDGARLLAASSHTVGSLFYTYFDMSDPQYQINRDFLKKGLARNEDDYFIATGREMAMIWHAPYYYLNNEILDTTGLLNYIYIGKELNVPDAVGEGESPLYRDSDALIEDLLGHVTPGAIIPVTLGRTSRREDYLYRHVSQLIEGLILEGYDFVPLENFTDTPF